MKSRVYNLSLLKRGFTFVSLILLFLLIVPVFLSAGCSSRGRAKSLSPGEKSSPTESTPTGSMPDYGKPRPVLDDPFPEKTSVTLVELLGTLRGKVRRFADSPRYRADFKAFCEKNKLEPSNKLYFEYVKSILIFEAVRDAGLWHIQWKITNQEPDSDKIWAQWKSRSGNEFNKKVTAEAECDEISALYAFLCRKMGVSGVGLFWPAGNHTVAVWKLKSKEEKEVRVVVPTTQIFLSNRAFFDETTFDPWSQEAVYDYTRDDAGDSLTIPAPLARFLMRQLDKYGGASKETLQYLRYMREGLLCGEITKSAAIQDIEEIEKEYKEAGVPLADVWALEYFKEDLDLQRRERRGGN